MLACHTFKGKLEIMTFTGSQEVPIAFNLMVAEDADESLVNMAAEAIGLFLLREYIPADNMEDDE